MCCLGNRLFSEFSPTCRITPKVFIGTIVNSRNKTTWKPSSILSLPGLKRYFFVIPQHHATGGSLSLILLFASLSQEESRQITGSIASLAEIETNQNRLPPWPRNLLPKKHLLKSLFPKRSRLPRKKQPQPERNRFRPKSLRWPNPKQLFPNAPLPRL